jgi:hypothetical protein
MKYVFDLDGTLCSNTDGKYKNALPFQERIKQVNNLFDQGHIITIFTARGMGSTNNNQLEAINKYYTLTEEQLKNWKIKYHNLVFGKPSADYYIDDKGINDNDFFKQYTP